MRRLQSSKMRIVNATEFLQHKRIRALDFKALIADTYRNGSILLSWLLHWNYFSERRFAAIPMF